LGAPGEIKVKPIWAGALAGPGRPGHLGNEELPERGSLIWRWPADPTDGSAAVTPKIVAPVALLDDLLCVPVAEGAQRGLVALVNDPSSKSPPQQRWHADLPNGVWLSPAIVPPDDAKTNPAAVLAVNGKRGDPGRQLHC